MLWDNKQIGMHVNAIVAQDRQRRSIKTLMQIMRGDYETRITQLEAEIGAKDARITELEAELEAKDAYIDDLESTTDETKLNERIAELEAHLAERIELATQ